MPDSNQTVMTNMMSYIDEVALNGFLKKYV